MATKTLGLTGSDYTTLAAAASYLNALSLSANEFLEVKSGGAIVDTAQVSLTGWTDNGFTVTIRPFSGQGFGDNASKLTNALRYNASNGAALTNSVGYTDAYRFGSSSLIVTGLQFIATASTASSTIKIWSGATVNRCILQRAAGGSYVVSQNGTNFTINDSLILHAGAGGGVQTTDTGVVINGCTIATTGATGIGIAQTYSVNPVVKNTAIYGFPTDVQNTAGSGTTNNATDKGTFGGTGWGVSGQTSLSSADFENVSSGSSDWRIKTGSTKLINTGAGSVGSGLDVVGTTRGGTYDIGAWEIGDAVAPTLTSPTGTATGATTATGAVSTNEANGTLYRLASTNATESAATVIAAALTQTVTATGSQAVSFAGLTASTTYYAHYVHRDAANNDSTRVSSSSFTTSAASTSDSPALSSRRSNGRNTFGIRR